MTFFEVLSGIEPDRPAVIAPTACYTYGDLCNRVSHVLPLVAGKRTVLSSSNVAQGVAVLAASDHSGSAVALLSPMLEPTTFQGLVTVFEPELVIDDRYQIGAAGLVDVVNTDFTGLESRKSAEWIMSTSGTTAAPKLVQHNFGSLTRTTRDDTQIGRGQVWGMIYDYTRFAGLQVVLQAMCSGAAIAQPDLRTTLVEQVAFLKMAGCTHLSATPTMWRKLLLTGCAEELKLQQVTLGGEIADDRILKALSVAFPEARVTHIFASTEAGAGFSVNDRQAGFPASFLDSPPLGVNIDVRNARLFIGNAMVGSKYLGENGAVSSDGWVNTGDIVALVGDRYLFCGRESGVINVGGDKVYPEQVESAALEHSDVQIARAYSKSSPIVGSLVALDVVSTAKVPAMMRDDLISHLKRRLQRHQMPAMVRVVDNLEIAASGKIQRV